MTTSAAYLSFALLLSGLVVTASSGCASSMIESGTPVVTSTGEPVTLDIFSARGFLGGSDYERYYLEDGVLWRECGNITRGEPKGDKRPALDGDSVFKSKPNLNLLERRVERLSKSQAAKLNIIAEQLLADEEGKIPAPGSAFSLSEPGIFELSISAGSKKKRIVTSVDAVADKSSSYLSAANSLFANLRSAGPVMCSAKTFFGIGRD